MRGDDFLTDVELKAHFDSHPAAEWPAVCWVLARFRSDATLRGHAREAHGLREAVRRLAPGQSDARQARAAGRRVLPGQGQGPARTHPLGGQAVRVRQLRQAAHQEQALRRACLADARRRHGLQVRALRQDLPQPVGPGEAHQRQAVRVRRPRQALHQEALPRSEDSHLDRVYGDGVLPFECPECHKRLATKASLAMHVRSHTEEKPLECTVCGKTLCTPEALWMHLCVHTGEKPHQCSFCPKCFIQQSILDVKVLPMAGPLRCRPAADPGAFQTAGLPARLRTARFALLGTARPLVTLRPRPTL